MSPKKAPKEEQPKEEQEEPEVTCPVCGNPVTLDDPFCPHCGAEFEEEEVEEIAIEEEVEVVPEEDFEVEEVEEEVEFEEVEPEEEIEEEAEEEVEYEEVEVEVEAEEPGEGEGEEEYEEIEYEEVVEVPEAVPAKAKAPASISLFDMRVFGIALLILGIIGLQIAAFISWYWTWVPPITDNLLLYALIGLAIVVIGFLAFTMIKKATVEKGKQYHPMLPTILLSIFIFGIFAVIFLLIGGPISDAMQDNQAIVAVLFLVFIVIGVVLYMMGQKKAVGTAA